MQIHKNLEELKTRAIGICEKLGIKSEFKTKRKANRKLMSGKISLG